MEVATHNKMKAIILAAGRGSRMKNLTEERPKCLVELHGKPLIEWQLLALRKAGIGDIAIVTGYKREMLMGYGLVEFHNPRWAETNMVSSLQCAEDWLLAEPCIVSYADIFYDASVVESLMASPVDLAVAYDPNWLALWQKRFGDPLIDAETFRLNPDGTLLEIGSKPHSIQSVEGQYMGLLRFAPRGWAECMAARSELPATKQDSLQMTGMLDAVIRNGALPIHAIPNNTPWGEVDNQEDLDLYLGMEHG